MFKIQFRRGCCRKRSLENVSVVADSSVSHDPTERKLYSGFFLEEASGSPWGSNFLTVGPTRKVSAHSAALALCAGTASQADEQGSL